MKYNAKRLCILHLILVGILYCPLRTGEWRFLLKHDESYLSIVPKTVVWAQHLFFHYLFIHILLLILSQHHIQPIWCGKLKDINNWLLNYFSRICVLIFPSPPSSFLKRQRFQNFVNVFDHIKSKNTKPVVTLMSNVFDHIKSKNTKPVVTLMSKH